MAVEDMDLSAYKLLFHEHSILVCQDENLLFHLICFDEDPWLSKLQHVYDIWADKILVDKFWGIIQ